MKRIYEYEDLQPVFYRLLQDKESSDLEFKSAKGGFPHSFWETYSSFANTDGGALTLALAYSEEEITNERLQHALNMHKADITAMLGQMCATHLLESSGHGRGTKSHVYGLNVALPKPNVALASGNVALNMDTSESNIALEGANMGLNIGLPDANIGLNVGLPEANVALPKRYTREQLKEKIREICMDWVTVDIIAARLNRDVRYVKNHILPQFSDMIEKMYDIPHHPRQKYRTKQKEDGE